MRKARSLYKEDTEFDLIQKTKRSSAGYKININYADDFSNNDIHNSKVSVANFYLTGLVKEMQETMLYLDEDDIFSELNNQKISNKKIPKIKINGIENKGKKNSLSKNLSLKKNMSLKNLPLYKKSSIRSNKSKSHSKNKHKNPKTSRSIKRKNTNKSNKSNKSNKNYPLSNRSNKKRKISDNTNNNGRINISINKDNKNKKMKRNLSGHRDYILKKEKEKIKKIENENKENLTQIGFKHMNSVNSYSFTKKSSFKPKEIKRFSYYMNPTQKFLKPFRTSTVKSQVSKSVKFKFDLSKKTYTNTFTNNGFQRKKIKPEIRRWSETKRRKSNMENSLFSFFQRPEYFEENHPRKTQSNDFQRNLLFVNFNQNDDNNEQLFKMSHISNKNILQLNEITQDLKKSIILTGRTINIKMQDLNKKSFLYDHESSYKSESDNNFFYETGEENEINEIDKEKNYRELQKKGMVYDSLDENNDDEEISNFFIHPDSWYLKILDFAVTMCITYNLIYIPFFLGYNEVYCNLGNYFSITSLIDLIIDIIYFIDFIIHFFVAYYNKEDVLKTDLDLIIINNLKTWFLIDLMGAIPFKTLFTIYDKKCKDIHFMSTYKYNNQEYYLLLVIRLLKTFRLYQNKFFEYLDEKLDKYEHYNNYLGVYIGASIFFLTSHLGICLLIFFGRNHYPSWITKFGFEESSFGELYFIGLYYLITTVTTVGYGDLTCTTPREKIFGMIVEIIGIVAYSSVLSFISNYVRSINDAEEEYFKKYRILQEIKITYNDLSDDLFDRINRYIKNKQNNEEQEKNLIDELPITLKNTLVYNMYEPIIENFVFFKNFDNKDFIVRVIFCFKPILAIRNDILIKDGDFVEDIIFVKKGKLSLELPIRINPDTETPKTGKSNGIYNSSTKSQSQNLSSIKTQNTKFGNYLNNFISNGDEFEEDEEEEIIEYQNLKLLDIRRNEHFGDVLMLSNERSPLTAIVKSRKAELFYLNKKDSIEISNEYPQIWSKIQKKSIFNMKQIKKLMGKVMKIFYKTNGIQSKKSELTSSGVSKSIDSDLQSIPSISEFTDNSMFSNNNIKNKYGKENIQNLKTIKEATVIEDSENSNSEMVKSKISSDILDYAVTKKIDSNYDTDSSNYTGKKSIKKDESTIRMDHFSNVNVEFSEIYSEKDIQQNYLTGKSELTPFKPDEINNEIYPHENEVFVKLHNNEANQNNNNFDKKISVIKDRNFIKANNNNNNISICSTEISFSISSKYENIDELSDYKYSKTPKLRKKIKAILKDYGLEVEFEFNKIKTNKTVKKSIISFGSIIHSNRKKEVKKTSSADLNNKKKKKTKINDKSSDNNIFNLTTLKNKPNFKVLDMINEKMGNSKVSTPINNQPPTFTQLIQNFIDNEKLENHQELKDEKEKLNQKIKKMRSVKDKTNNLFKIQNLDYDTS